MSQDIRDLTNTLLKDKIEVRWFDGLMQNSVMLADPNTPKAWVRVEVLIPRQSSGKRPSFRVSKAKNEKVFDLFRDSFDKLWKDSVNPLL